MDKKGHTGPALQRILIDRNYESEWPLLTFLICHSLSEWYWLFLKTYLSLMFDENINVNFTQLLGKIGYDIQ